MLRPWLLTRIPRRSRGFTLVEILIVVVILGILAAIVVPQFSGAAETASDTALKEDLRTIRAQTLLYSSQHRQIGPGFPAGNPSGTPTETLFVTQMTRYSDDLGNTSTSKSTTYKYGPYIIYIPPNPINQLSTVRVLGTGSFPTTAAGTHGWIYQPSTFTFASDATGTDSNGVAYIDY